MRISWALLAMLFAIPALARPEPPVAREFGEWTGPLPEKPPCRCRSKQGKVGLGTTLCMRQNGRMVTMECTLVLNNTAWRKLHDGCDMAALEGAALEGAALEGMFSPRP